MRLGRIRKTIDYQFKIDEKRPPRRPFSTGCLAYYQGDQARRALGLRGLSELSSWIRGSPARLRRLPFPSTFSERNPA
jgi:hypothetical protein